jgi:hypothetical protein
MHIGDVLLFTRDEWVQKPGARKEFVRELKRWLSTIGLELSIDNDESMQARVTRIYGDAIEAPPSVLIATYELMSRRLLARGRPSPAMFHRFIDALHAPTVGDVIKHHQDGSLLHGATRPLGARELANNLAIVLKSLGIGSP